MDVRLFNLHFHPITMEESQAQKSLVPHTRLLHDVTPVSSHVFFSLSVLPPPSSALPRSTIDAKSLSLLPVSSSLVVVVLSISCSPSPAFAEAPSLALVWIQLDTSRIVLHTEDCQLTFVQLVTSEIRFANTVLCGAWLHRCRAGLRLPC